ncbi:carboxypeptidase-like regulatory domain-containing protein [Leptospira limi]|uniref:Carboxypeptidase-like regulatory domain-containing protein n=1 Tax=Leptospira limi TaxID=2950023 RepID=A0ABT3LS87_9LEPT|nr:carboxypeptidase-like regulatory domain-containing protein [Leptospira limi]MCW7460598.1 carboxypeptidase-like regulatory domain-containing protein [Leptospira limi]
MNLRSIQITNFSFRNFSKRFGIFVVPILLFQNCYLNPVVYDLLNPAEKEENPAALSLLGLGPSAMIVTGQIFSGPSGVSGATVRIFGSTDPTNVSTTDSAGRFKLIGSEGTMNLQVEFSGTTFTIELFVTPIAVSLISISNSSFTVLNLGMYSSSLGNVSFFDLTSSNPYNGLIVSNNPIYTATIGNDFNFSFSENLEVPSDANQWRIDNILISPTLSYFSTSVSGNQVDIQVNPGSYSFQTYTITLLPGIKSLSGKSLKQTMMQFQISFLP